MTKRNVATKEATFRVIRFETAGRYVGLAWNYDEAILISTKDCVTYTEARSELEEMCGQRGVALRWYDGEYSCREGFIYPADVT
jgi:hypothetical protein